MPSRKGAMALYLIVCELRKRVSCIELSKYMNFMFACRFGFSSQTYEDIGRRCIGLYKFQEEKYKYNIRPIYNIR